MIKTIFEKDLVNNRMSITREFASSLEDVWQAWTDSKILDQWWAPRPWKARTKSMDFREGGFWLYCMEGPDGDKQWAKANYKKIKAPETFEAVDAFCDEDGNENAAFPKMTWKTSFKRSANGTTVDISITYASRKEMEQVIEMGFEVGFSAAHENLDQYLEAKFKLRNDLKINGGPRVSTFLNFPGNTEEAFNFYKSVFKTEFSGKGIQRFGDIPAETGHPPIAESVKKMVLHVELPTIGGHVLMATDSPREMGFTLQMGNNMHICLEPSTRKETKRLFDELSKGGDIKMPLQDMFFGSYFGQSVDKFGVNWMFNCYEKP
jgi:uncharacterized glyoxalase superfamily protein PhnB/uncharacterized protein YndB with AHSA1/START domain